ncbi:hypothetical protein DXV75_13950 [Alteromonas aestuariivivens]|uniref:Bacterial transglutaminase-like N-terminal domain-containing protein n=1 Tax=Alteromonas aestuariivivens TaxID=1938339 RepID=A0A3D8M4M1_9ALTE|nr:transglutaminase N-terminal domain-containing protein [Alteromonas aestuariivivens]RDV24520.1 hypothetical protein DXV75_13950 [Alteromonas aestuariivivens]
MKRLRVVYQNISDFSDQVQLQPHTLRLRPREGHEQRIESSSGLSWYTNWYTL